MESAPPRTPDDTLPTRAIIAELLDTIDRLEHERDQALEREEKAARYRHHLSYRLGAEIVKRSRSLTGWLSLPFGLVSAYRAFRRDMARGGDRLQRRRRVQSRQNVQLLPDTILPSLKPEFRWVRVLAYTEIRLSGIAFGGQDDNNIVFLTIARYRNFAGRIIQIENISDSRQIFRPIKGAEFVKVEAVHGSRFEVQFLPPLDASSAEIGFVTSRNRQKFALNVFSVVLAGEDKDYFFIEPKLESGEHDKIDDRYAEFTETENLLWGGFSDESLARLEALKTSPDSDPDTVCEAAWALARWYAVHEAQDRVQSNLDTMAACGAAETVDLRYVLLRCATLLAAQRHGEARRVVRRALDAMPRRPSLHLALANTHHDDPSVADPDAERLACINRVFADRGLAPVGRRDADTALTLDTVTTLVTDVHRVDDDRLVSVIVPAFNAADTLPYALRSLLEQTWRRLEILVVDDCSTDDTLAVAESIAAADGRVRVLRQDRNRGAYAARNRGLAEARGDFITVNDADDWAHAQKVAQHVTALDDGAVGSISHWARVSRDLLFLGNFRPTAAFVHWNHSSLMIETEAARALGGWDAVRFGGDTEFIERIQRLHGETAIAWVLRGVPLQFALNDIKSLTNAGPSHVRTVYHGVRRTYREAWRHWHRGGDDLLFPRIDDPDSRDPVGAAFPAPAIMLAAPRPEAPFDCVAVADWNDRGEARARALAHVDMAAAQGLAVGVLHWPQYLGAAAPLDGGVLARAARGALRVISPGDAVSARGVLIADPAPLRWRMDNLPAIETAAVVVLSDGQVDDAMAVQRARLRDWFGHDGLWVATDAADRRALEVQSGLRCTAEPWHPPLSVLAAAPRGRWRGAGRPRPVLGRIAPDTAAHWPEDPEALRASHCAEQDCYVEILGGVATAAERLGTLPSNWRALDDGGIDHDLFLSRLDGFIHHPGSGHAAQPSLAALRAMAAGVPVVLPPACAETVGAAALCVTADAVWPALEVLWRDEEAWCAQAAAGHAFVRAQCSAQAWHGRWEALVSEAVIAPGEHPAEALAP